jgi:hypothetical protein
MHAQEARWFGEIKPKSAFNFILCVTTFCTFHQENAADDPDIPFNLAWYHTGIVPTSIPA